LVRRAPDASPFTQGEPPVTRKRIFFLLAVLAIGALAFAGYKLFFHRADVLEGSGTVEAYDVHLGSEIGGRILEVLAREGQRVEVGQVLVTFDERQLKAALVQAQANYDKLVRGSRPEEIAAARAAAAQARADYEEKRNGNRIEDILAARADVERTRADTAHAEITYKRAHDLANADVFSQQQKDDAESAWKQALATQHNAEQKLVELERGFRPEEIASAEQHYRQLQATMIQTERGNRKEDIEFAYGQLLDAQGKYLERQVLSPNAATVEVLNVRPGDLIPPNTPIATLLEVDQIHVRIYIPETKIGLVRLGEHADVTVDSFPKEIFSAVVEQVNEKAEFLPRNVETKDERVHQVFGVKLRIQDPSGRIRAGMAADVKLKP
jgi:HlyD family secretion protein